MAALEQRLASAYGEALKKAVQNVSEALKQVEMLDEKQKELEAKGWENDKIKRWRREEMNRLLNAREVTEGIMQELDKAGIAVTPEIKKTLAEVYRVNANAALEMVNDRVGIRLPMIGKRYARLILDDTQGVFSKIAFANLGQNAAVRRRLQNEFAQAALLGESQQKVVRRIRDAAGMSAYQAKRVAQTEGTRVRSQARNDSMKTSAAYGVKMTKEWSTFMDGRQRDSHGALDGTVIPMGEKFRTINGNLLEFPGDPNAPAEEVINCRCVMIPDVVTDEKTLNRGAESGIIETKEGIEIEIDEFTPCLRRISDGQVV